MEINGRNIVKSDLSKIILVFFLFATDNCLEIEEMCADINKFFVSLQFQV